MTMPSTTLLWTTLPAGVRLREGQWLARLSVFLTPRLAVPQGEVSTLSSFPDFIDWPATLRARADKGLALMVQMSDGERVSEQTTVALPFADDEDLPDSAAWRSIFDASTPVRTFDAPDEMPKMFSIQSYPARGVVDAIRDAYLNALAFELGVQPEPPSLAAFAASPSVMQHGDSPLARFARFHRRSEKAASRKSSPADDDCTEFHRIVSALGTHPLLLRRLGLVLDIELPLEALGIDEARNDLRVRVVPVGATLAATNHYCQWTAVEYATAATDTFRVFTPAHRDGSGRSGFQALGGERTTIIQEKLEHAVFTLSQHAGKVLGDTATLPALLQGGMRVAHADTPRSIENAIHTQAQLEKRLNRRQGQMRAGVLDCPHGDEPLYADQLTRGCRIDVRDMASRQWRSLCRRQLRYRADSWTWPSGQSWVEDEGVIEPTAHMDHHAEQSTLRATEDLFEWDGWSLVVPRPDHSSGSGPDASSQCASDDMPALSTQMQVPPGSLEPQRFGRCYQFRARAVDLAGNSLSTAEADALEPALAMQYLVTRPVCYLRVESAKPPAILRADPRGAGEAGDIIVLRDAESPRYRTREFRVHVLPPEVPLRIAEKHGLFDHMNAGDSWRLIDTHRGRLAFESAHDEQEDGSPLTLREPLADRQLYTPYLADPMVKQAILMLPDGAGSLPMPAFDDLPPSAKGSEFARSCGLVVRTGEHGLRAHVSGRQVVLEVPKGRVQTVRIAALLSSDELLVSAFAHAEWQQGHNRATQQTAGLMQSLSVAAARGEAPLLAPFRSVRIIHATQRPLTSPQFVRPLILPRPPNSSSATLADDALEFDRPSTGRIDVYASWEDPVDNPQEDAWRTTRSELHAGGVRIASEGGKPLDPGEPGKSERAPLSHDFGDTRHREVTYQAVGLSRFVEFYPASLTSEPDKLTRSSRPITLHVPSTAAPASVDVAYVIPTFGRKDTVLDRKTPGIERRTEQIGDGLRIYLNRGWFSSGKGEQLAVVLATAGTPDSLHSQVSSWGMNPIRDSAPLPGRLRLEHVWGGAQRIDNWTLDQGSVGLVLVDVGFSEEHGLPFSDIEFLSQRAFMPLLRLALARYQAHAIEGCKLSRIVHADFVPLAPGRTVTVKQTGRATWHLGMHGHSYRQSDDSTSVVQAHIEYMERALPWDAASWRPLGEPVRLTPSRLEAWRYHWSGELRVTDFEYLSGHWRRRLVIREFECFDPACPDDEPLDNLRLISAHAVMV